MAVAKVTRLEREIAEGRENAEAARRVSLYNEAKAARDAAAKRLEEEYPRCAAGIVAVLADADEADRKVAWANRDLPEGFSPLEYSEVAARHTPGRPREIISEEIVDRWVFETSRLPCDVNIKDYPLKVNSDGKSGLLRGPSNSIPVLLSPFKKVVSRPAQRGVLPARFYDELRLPALKGDYLIYPSNSDRLAALGREEIVVEPSDEVEPDVEVTFEPLKPVSP